MSMEMGSKRWIQGKKVKRSGFTDQIILTSKGKKKRIKANPKLGQSMLREWCYLSPYNPHQKRANNFLTSKEKQHSKCVSKLESLWACVCNDDFWVPKPTKSKSSVPVIGNL